MKLQLLMRMLMQRGVDELLWGRKPSEEEEEEEEEEHEIPHPSSERMTLRPLMNPLLP